MTLPRYAHQIEDMQALLAKPAFALFCEPGTGKSRTVVDAVCAFAKNGGLSQVIIVCPAAVRSIWADPDPILGEWAKWADPDVPYTLTEYTPKLDLARFLPHGLAVLVTNPEFVRRPERLAPLQQWAKRCRTFLVVDESWAYKTPNAAQTKAIQRLRACCGRVVILNGTPGEPREQYSQFAILDRRILGSFNHQAFKARYCVMGGFQNYQVVGYRNMPEYHAKTAPYCIVRKLRDCVDIGPEPLRTHIEATLSPKTWALYTELRDELIVWLSEHERVTTLQAGVTVMRLAQMCNGFVGGVSGAADLFDAETGEEASRIAPDLDASAVPGRLPPSPLREIGREKLDALLAWLRDYWHDTKLLIFTRFRADVERTVRELRAAFPSFEVLPLYGDQTKDERDRAKRLLAPGGDETPAIVVANAASGGAGLNLAAAHICIFLGLDYSFRVRRQAEGRVDRPGQTERVTLLDIIAVGPNKERTIDHHILSALRRKEDIETWSTREWRKALA